MFYKLIDKHKPKVDEILKESTVDDEEGVKKI
jgi:hypothetical protein